MVRLGEMVSLAMRANLGVKNFTLVRMNLGVKRRKGDFGGENKTD